MQANLVLHHLLQIGGSIGTLMTRTFMSAINCPPRRVPVSAHMNYPYYHWHAELILLRCKQLKLLRGNKRDLSIHSVTFAGSCGPWMMPRCPTLYAYGSYHGQRKVFFHSDEW